MSLKSPWKNVLWRALVHFLYHLPPKKMKGLLYFIAAALVAGAGPRVAKAQTNVVIDWNLQARRQWPASPTVF